MRGEDRELAFSGCRVSVWEAEKILEMGPGDGCTIIYINLILQNCILKMVKIENFI